MNLFKPDVAKQLWQMLLSHILTMIVLAALTFSAVISLTDNPTVSMIFSIVTTIVYFYSLYSKARFIAGRDKLSYTSTTVYFWKGAILPVLILLWNLLIWLCYIFAWRHLTIDGELACFSGLFYNVLFVLNTYCYQGLSEIANGTVVWYLHILIYAVPLTASVLGYISGIYDFSLSNKLLPFIYEKKK